MAQKKKKTESDVRIESAGKADRLAGAGNRVELKLTQDASIFIEIGNGQDQGARPYQEDSFGYSDLLDSQAVSRRGLAAVLADGMGGLSNGKEVSDYVVRTSLSLFDAAVDPTKPPIQPQLEAIVTSVNQQVCREYYRDGASTAGSTIVFAYIFKNRIYWATVGDSRLYCLRNGNLMQMNEDHDFRNYLFRRYLDGDGTLEEIDQDRQKDSLVSFIGRESMELIDSSVSGLQIKPGDAFVLCSDGIYNAISEVSMARIIREYDAQTASERIVESVLNAQLPGQDNLTIMILKCSKGGGPVK